MGLIRLFSNAAGNGSKNLLAALRKKTGFTLSNCRQALQCNDNDLAKAEKWLENEAKRLGWEKIYKLQNRTASEGLIAITKTKNKVAMAEVNCETDFVARNKNFIALAEMVAKVCILHPVPHSDINKKMILLTEDLANLETPEKENLMDFTAKRVGEFGEKIVLKKAVIFEVDEDINLDIAVHPPNSDQKEVLTGKYGAFIAYKNISGSSVKETEITENFGKNLCTHIIGMNPSKIGSMQNFPSENVNDENVDGESSFDENIDGESSFDENDMIIEDQNYSSELVQQNFILNNKMTVGEILIKNGKEVINFHRFECGEDEEIKSELNAVETDDLKECKN